MKLQIFTYHSVYNFGANLQALATALFLMKKGHDVELLNFRPKSLDDFYKQTVPPKQADCHEYFVKKYLPLSPILLQEEDLKNYLSSQQPDGLILGSDSVLRVSSRPQSSDQAFGNPFWLKWFDTSDSLKKIPTALLSVSCMGSQYYKLPQKFKKQIYNFFKKRNYITVRDYWTSWMIRMINPFHRLKIYQNVDPVFILSKFFDLSKVNLYKFHLPKRYILYSFSKNLVTKEWMKEFVNYANDKGIAVVELPTPEHWDLKLYSNHKISIPLSPLEWYKIIANSEGFIGIRFHPIVVCIANSVPFIAIDNYGSTKLSRIGINFPSKTYDLCYKAGMVHRIIHYTNIEKRSPKTAVDLLTDRKFIKRRPYESKYQDMFTHHMNRILTVFSKV